MTDQELREAIAVEVMGLDVLPTEEQLREHKQSLKDWGDAWAIYGSELAGPPSRPKGPEWYKMHVYESDLAAAWEVVEVMRTKGWEFSLHDQAEQHEWNVQLDNKTDHWSEDAPTVPLAICKAALTAIRSQNEIGSSTVPSTE